MAFVFVGTLINALAINVGMWIGGKSTPACLVSHCRKLISHLLSLLSLFYFSPALLFIEFP
jgi:hypothetical protein